jgi:hypothetical protein
LDEGASAKEKMLMIGAIMQFRSGMEELIPTIDHLDGLHKALMA